MNSKTSSFVMEDLNMQEKIQSLRKEEMSIEEELRLFSYKI